MPKLHKDYSGRTINKRKVIAFAYFTKNNDPKWFVQCACGYVFSSLTQDLKRDTCRRCRNKDKRKRPFESLYNTFYSKASKQHKVDISYEQFLEFTKISECHYCGSNVEWLQYQSRKNGKKHKGQCYNLDRKNNVLHYTVDNVVVCCSRCNLAKNKYFTYDEWKQLGEVIRTWRGKECEECNKDHLHP